MNKKTRKGVFETNSSSTHSITINVHKIEKCPHAPIVLDAGEFGWEVAIYNDIYHKASYLFTYILHYELGYARFDDKPPTFEQITANPKFKMLQKAIREVTGRDPVIGYLQGYIDHQSNHVAKEVFDKGIEYIKYFLFNSNNTLETDHDNH